MAAIAIVVHRKLFEPGWSNGAMGVMTITAHQFVFADRVGRGLKGLGPNGLMAGITDFRLGSALLYLAGLVYRMATDAGHVIGFVRTGLPVQQVVVLQVAAWLVLPE